MKKHLFNIKRKFYFYSGVKKCAVIGDYDTVVGFKSILKELDLEVDRLQVLYNTSCVEEGILISNEEFERMNYLKNTDLLALLSDGASMIWSTSQS